MHYLPHIDPSSTCLYFDVPFITCLFFKLLSPTVEPGMATDSTTRTIMLAGQKCCLLTFQSRHDRATLKRPRRRRRRKRQRLRMLRRLRPAAKKRRRRERRRNQPRIFRSFDCSPRSFASFFVVLIVSFLSFVCEHSRIRCVFAGTWLPA